MEELRKIINELKKIIESEGLDVSGNEILELAGKLYMCDNINNSKKKEYIVTPVNNNEVELATEKQKYMLKQIGYKDDKIKNMTKSEAFLIIKKVKEA